jgi:hypothetical protein
MSFVIICSKAFDPKGFVGLSFKVYFTIPFLLIHKLYQGLTNHSLSVFVSDLTLET